MVYKKIYYNGLPYFHHINIYIRDIYSLLMHTLEIFSLINVYVRDIYLSLILLDKITL
jgi:hypothetical protein